MSLLPEMRRSRLEPVVISCNVTISACAPCLEPAVVRHNAAIHAREQGHF